MNCEWDDGIPYSLYKLPLDNGLFSQKICLSIILITSFNRVPIKNTICNKCGILNTRMEIILMF